MRKYARTWIIGVLMAGVIASTITWGIDKWAACLPACLLAATVVLAQHGADWWQDRYREAEKRHQDKEGHARGAT